MCYNRGVKRRRNIACSFDKITFEIGQLVVKNFAKKQKCTVKYTFRCAIIRVQKTKGVNCSSLYAFI